MYIGSTSQQGITHLVLETIDNSFDEFMTGYGEEIDITIKEDSTVVVRDYARGIPVGPHHKWKNKDGTPMNTLTGVLTKLHAGGKFNQEDGGYKVSGGLHGVGVKAVNALSEKFTTIVRREGKVYQQDFEEGKPVTEVEVIDTCDKNNTGTTIKYRPDDKIFKFTTQPSCKELRSRLKELVALNAGITVNYHNEITDVEEEFYSDKGIIGYVEQMVKDNELLYEEPFHLEGEYELDNGGIIKVEIGFIHDDEKEPDDGIKTFANNINTHEGGFHLKGFRRQYKKEINKWGKKNNLLKSKLAMKYVFDGIHAVVSIKVPEAEFEGQTKTKLGNAEAQDAVEHVVKKEFKRIKKEHGNKTILEQIIDRGLKAKKAEAAARKARRLARKANKTTRMSLPGKLADCSNRKNYSELFIVEGDSAAGSAKQGRYRKFQAILPLKGKVLNTQKANFERVINSKAIKNIVAAIGGGVGEEFDINNVRYDKIIIMTDADDDGMHIKALLLTLFYNYMPEILEEGLVYATIPPLYRVTKGKEKFYLADEHELKDFKKDNPNRKIEVQRFKGLGEMNYNQLKTTTMDPQTRTLKQINIKDVEEAQKAIFTCMGAKASKRRDFIEANAGRVNIDFVW
jgi:DNA gyrase subunit B